MNMTGSLFREQAAATVEHDDWTGPFDQLDGSAANRSASSFS